MAQTRPVTLVIDGVSIEIDMDVNQTLDQLESFIKTPAFKAESKAYHIKTEYSAGDNLEFHYNSEQTPASLKHLSLKQFHPKKKLLFYITKVTANQAPQKPQLNPPISESLIERSADIGSNTRLLNFVIHKGASENPIQKTFTADVTVLDLKKSLGLATQKTSEVRWTKNDGTPIKAMTEMGIDSRKISSVNDIWMAAGTIHIYEIHHSA